MAATHASDTSPPSAIWRDQLLDAMLAQAPASGWPQQALLSAARACGLGPGEVMLAAPGGVADILRALTERVAEQVRARFAEPEVAALRIRDKATLGVGAVIDALTPHREAVKRAAASGFAPGRMLLGPEAAWRFADAIWDGMGDRSTDANWYTKRLTLSAVVASTLLVWINGGGREEVDAFLARRIEGVMQFEKTKASLLKTLESCPNPLDLLGRKAG